MSPEEAAIAAHILRAKQAVPIHYGAPYTPQGYVEAPRAAERFATRAAELGAAPLIAGRGAWIVPA
jgi:L-ascorbate metabolism protein UlaG (beta-lactamase superfamily)